MGNAIAIEEGYYQARSLFTVPKNLFVLALGLLVVAAVQS